MMTSSALVLFMTLPGLFLFYGGSVRRKNILSVIAQCFGIAGLVTILWVIFGYSMVFADGSGSVHRQHEVRNAGCTAWIHCRTRTTPTGCRTMSFHVSAHVRDHHARADPWRHCRSA